MHRVKQLFHANRLFLQRNRAMVDGGVRFLLQTAKYGCIGSVIGTHFISFISVRTAPLFDVESD